MTRWLIVLAALLLMTGSAPPGFSQTPAAPPTVQVALHFDGPGARNDALRTQLHQEIQELTRRRFDVQFLDAHDRVSDWTMAGVRRDLAALLADPEVDVVIATGYLGSQVLAMRDTLPTPAVGAAILDAAVQQVPQADGRSGVPNLTYLAMPQPIRRDVQGVQDLVSVEHLAILVHRVYLDAMPGLDDALAAIAAAEGLQATVVPVGASVEAALQALPAATDAVYVTPMMPLDAEAFDRLTAGLIERGLPSLAYRGAPDVERGLMASFNPDLFARQVRRVALHVQRILLGDDPSALPVVFAVGERLLLNMAAVRAVGVSPPFGMLLEADRIHEAAQQTEPLLTLEEAMREGVRTNLALAAGRRALAAGVQDVRMARSALLPQLDLTGSATVIDEDRAEASFGSQAERTLTGGAQVSQVIYSEPARANLAVQQALQEARTYDHDAERLDLALQAARAYLGVLRAESVEHIEEENLRRTRSNLELAKIRETIGQAAPGEVLRWEGEMAQRRKARIEAHANRRAAEMALNQLLHRPIEAPFRTEAADLTDPMLTLGTLQFEDIVQYPPRFQAFRDFMVAEAIREAPEMQSLDAAMDAQRRRLRSAQHAFWQPTLSLQGQLTSRLLEAGAGVDPPTLSVPDDTPLPTDLLTQFPQPGNTIWNVGLNLRFPIFQGGAKNAERVRAAEELARLQLQEELTRQRIEQQVRTRLHFAGASYAGIREARTAVQAAERTLDLVQQAYAQGAATVLDLLDAQNTVVVTREQEAHAVYDCLLDLMEVQRALGRFTVFMTPGEQQAFQERLSTFLEEHD